jgi:dUTP pyrophosphatase
LTVDTTLIVERVHPEALLPKKALIEDACFDLFSAEERVVPPGATQVLGTGLQVQIEPGWEAQVRGRSGLASRGLVVHPGTIDSLYRKELKIIVHNLSDQDWAIAPQDRIAQMKLSRVWSVELIEGKVQPTERGGLGSTGR